jgi:predicted transcriptional regulator
MSLPKLPKLTQQRVSPEWFTKESRPTIIKAAPSKTFLQRVGDFIDRNIVQPLPYTLSPRETPQVRRTETGEMQVYEGLAPMKGITQTRGFLKSPEDVEFYTKSIAPIAIIEQLPARLGETLFRTPIQFYTNVAGIIMGTGKHDTELPFDARRIGAKEQIIKTTGERFFNRVLELKEDKKPESPWEMVKISTQAAFEEVLPDMLDALITGSMTDTAARQTLRFTKYDPRVEKTLSQLGIPKDQVTKTTTKEWSTKLNSALRDTPTIEGKHALIQDAAYLAKKYRAAGGPYQLTPAFQRIENVSKQLIGIDAQVRAISPAVGLPGFGGRAGIGLGIDPLKGIQVQEALKLAKQGMSVAQIAQKLNVTQAVVEATIGGVARGALDSLAKEATKYKSAEEFVDSRAKVTDGVKHLDPEKYNNEISFVRDIERLNKGAIPATKEIEVGEKLWGDRPKEVVEYINPREIRIAEEPLRTTPDPGREITEPIIVQVIDGVPTLVDGRHRLAQAIANKQDTIPAKIEGKSEVSQLEQIWKDAQATPPSTRKLLGEPISPFVRMRETTVLKKKIRDYARGVREGRIDIRTQAKEVVGQFQEIIKPLPATDKAKFITQIKSITTSTDPIKAFYDNFPKIQSRVIKLIDAETKRTIQDRIARELKYTKPIKVGDKRVAKYHYEFNKTLEDLKKARNLNQEEAQQNIDFFQSKVDKGEALSEMEKIKSRLYSLQANGTKSSVELHSQVLRDIKRLKNLGKMAKDIGDFIDKVERAERVKDVATAIDKIKGDLRDVGFVDKVKTSILNTYLRGVSNTGSFLNGIAGKDIAEKYDPELWQNRKDTATFKVTRNLNRELAKDIDLKNENALLSKFVDFRKETITLTDLDGIGIDIDKMQLIDIYNSVKNPLLKERYYNAFGKEQIDNALLNLSENEIMIADRMMDSVQRYKEVFNKRNIEITGRDMGTIDNYWPATTEYRPDVYDDIRLQGETPSAMKERTRSARVIPEPTDAWMKTQKHISQGEHVRHLSRKHEELKRLFTNRTIKKRIENKFGEDVYKDLMKHIDNISLNKITERMSSIEGAFNKILNNWVRAKIVSPTVPIRQLGSMTNFMENMPSHLWIADFTKNIISPKATFDYVWKKYPEIGDFLEARFNKGYSEALKDALSGSNHLQTKANTWTGLFSLPVRTGDVTAIIYGGAPYIKHLERKSVKMGLTGNKAKRYIIDNFEKNTLKAQQSGVSSGLSSLQNSPNPFTRLFFRFKNTLNQYLRKNVDAIINYKRGEIPIEQMGKTVFHYSILQPIMYVLIGAGVISATKSVGNILRGEDPDEPDVEKIVSDIYTQMAVQPFQALPIIGDIAEYGIRNMMGKPTYSVIRTPVLDDIEIALRKATKKEPTIDDYLSVLSVIVEGGIGVPTEAIMRYREYLLGGDKKTSNLPDFPDFPDFPD